MAEQRLRRRRSVRRSIGADVGHTVLTQVSATPRVYVRDGVIGVDDAAAIRAAANDPEGLGVDTTHRSETGFSFEFPIEAHAATAALRSRLEALLGEPNEVGDTFRFRHYVVGEGHGPHTDNFTIGDCDLVATAMVCLSDVDGGGRTTFDAGIPAVEVAPRLGRLVAWMNCLPDGTPDGLARHAGEVVTAGEKVTATWFVYRPPRASRLVARGPIGLGT